MTNRMTAILLFLALICGCFVGCGREQKPGEESGSISSESISGGSTDRETREAPAADTEEVIPTTDLPRIDWNTAF